MTPSLARYLRNLTHYTDDGINIKLTDLDTILTSTVVTDGHIFSMPLFLRNRAWNTGANCIAIPVTKFVSGWGTNRFNYRKVTTSIQLVKLLYFQPCGYFVPILVGKEEELFYVCKGCLLDKNFKIVYCLSVEETAIKESADCSVKLFLDINTNIFSEKNKIVYNTLSKYIISHIKERPLYYNSSNRSVEVSLRFKDYDDGFLSKPVLESLEDLNAENIKQFFSEITVL